MQYHPSLYYIIYLGTLLFAVQVNVSLVCYGFYLLFTTFFSDAADTEQLAY